MYYNRLGVSKTAAVDEIRDKYFAIYKIKKDIPAELTLINKGKSCLTDAKSRSAYDHALSTFGIPDGERGGLVEAKKDMADENLPMKPADQLPV